MCLSTISGNKHGLKLFSLSVSNWDTRIQTFSKPLPPLWESSIPLLDPDYTIIITL
jgi:hypothetical protein